MPGPIVPGWLYVPRATSNSTLIPDPEYSQNEAPGAFGLRSNCLLARLDPLHKTVLALTRGLRYCQPQTETFSVDSPAARELRAIIDDSLNSRSLSVASWTPRGGCKRATESDISDFSPRIG